MRVAIESGKGMKVKVLNSVETSEMDLYLCISMTNNVESCKKINGRVQTFRFSVFTMGHQELFAKNGCVSKFSNTLPIWGGTISKVMSKSKSKFPKDVEVASTFKILDHTLL